jgi:hypothetical protein
LWAANSFFAVLLMSKEYCTIRMVDPAGAPSINRSMCRVIRSWSAADPVGSLNRTLLVGE